MQAFPSNLMTFLRRLLVLVLGLVAVPSWVLACTVPPRHIYRDHDELLKEARQVLLVEARAAADAPGGCRQQFEELAPDGDRWLAHVERRLGPGRSPSIAKQPRSGA